MTSRARALSTAAFACTFAFPLVAFAACDASSGPRKAALVELYTSEGCSSCPPADRRLRELPRTLGPAASAVALALHVDYWDYLGWHDPYAQHAFSERQRRLVELNRGATVYTPHFFVGGTELDLSPQALVDEVQRVNAAPPKAQIHVQANLRAGDVLELTADAKAAVNAPRAALYVAVTESALTSNVMRGENGGATLVHDRVVRSLIGPIQLSGGAAHAKRDLMLSPSWNRGQLDVATFVEDEATGEVLQAVDAGKCVRG